MTNVDMDKFHKDLKKAFKSAKSELDCMGNGYGWAAENTLADLTPAIQKHLPDFDPDKIW